MAFPRDKLPLPAPATRGRALPSRRALSPRPQLQPLPEFVGTARTGTVPGLELQVRLETFVVEQYRAGWSLRGIGKLVDRSQTAVRRVLDKHGVPRHPVGAHPVRPQRGARGISGTSSITGT